MAIGLKILSLSAFALASSAMTFMAVGKPVSGVAIADFEAPSRVLAYQDENLRAFAIDGAPPAIAAQEQAKAAAEALANGTLCSTLKSNVVHANGAVQMLDISTDASGTQTSLVCHGGIPVALILSAPDQEPVVIPANVAATGRDTCPQTGRKSISIPAA